MAGDAKSKKKQAPAAKKLKGTASTLQPPPSGISGISNPSKTQQLRKSSSNTQVATPPTSAKKFKDEDYYAALEEQSSSEFVGIVEESREKRLQKLPDAKRKHHKSSKKDGTRGGVDENEDFLAYEANVVERSRAYPRDANALGGVFADATHPYIVGDFSPDQIQHSKHDREKVRPGVRPVPEDHDNPNAVFADYHRHQLLQQQPEKKRFSKLRRNKKAKQADKDEAAIMAERRFPQPPRVGSETFKFFRRVYANIWRLQISDEEIQTPRRIVGKTSSVFAPQSDDLDDGFDDYIDDDKNAKAIAPGANTTYWSHSSADDMGGAAAAAFSGASSRQPSRSRDRRRPSSKQREKERLKQQKKMQKKQKYRISQEPRGSGEPAFPGTTDDEESENENPPYDRNQPRTSSYDPDRLSIEQQQWRTSDETLPKEQTTRPSPSSGSTRRPKPAQQQKLPDSTARTSAADKKPVSTPASDRLTVEDAENEPRRSSRLSVRGRLSDMKQKRSHSKELRKQQQQQKKADKRQQKLEDDRNSMRLSASKQQMVEALTAPDDYDQQRDSSSVYTDADEQVRTSDADDAPRLSQTTKPEKPTKAEKRASSRKPSKKDEKRDSSKQRAKSKQRPPVSSRFIDQLAGVPDRAVMQARLASTTATPSTRGSQRQSQQQQNLIDFEDGARKTASPPKKTAQQQQRTMPIGPRSSAPWQKPLTEEQQRNIPPPVRRVQAPVYLSTTSPPRQSVSDQFYSAIETSEQPTNLISTAQLSKSQPITKAAQKKAAEQQQSLFRTAPPPFQTRRSIADTGTGGGRGSVREASFGGEDDELLLLPVDDDENGSILDDEDYAVEEDDENYLATTPIPPRKQLSDQGTSPVPKKELKHIRKEQSRDAKRAESQKRQAEKQQRKREKSSPKKLDGRTSTTQEDENLDEGGGQKRPSNGLTAEDATDEDQDGEGQKSAKRDKRSKSREERQQQKQAQKQQKTDKKLSAAQIKADNKRSKKGVVPPEDVENGLLGKFADEATESEADRLTAEEENGDQTRRSSRLSIRGRASDVKQKRSRSREAKQQRKQQKKADDGKTSPAALLKATESKQSKKQRPQQVPIRITVEDENSSSPTENLLITIVNRPEEQETDENGSRRSSRLSLRDLKEHQSKERKELKQKQKQQLKEAKLTAKGSKQKPSGKNTEDEDDTERDSIGADDETGTRLTAEVDEDGKRRSSRLSMRGLKEQRSRSKQRKKEKQDQKQLDKSTKQQTAEKAKTKNIADSEKQTPEESALIDMDDRKSAEAYGERLTADETTDEDDKRRSSRLSMRRSMRERRSKSNQRKKEKQKQKQTEKTAKQPSSGRTKQKQDVDESGSPLIGMAASDRDSTAVDDDQYGERPTAEQVDEDGKRRSSRLSMRGLKEKRSRSKQRKKEKQDQKKVEKGAKQQTKPSGSSKSVRKQDDESALIDMAASDRDSTAVDDNEEYGDRLTAENDEDEKRRSSRLSRQSLKEEHRSQSKQRKLDKQQQNLDKKQQKLDEQQQKLDGTKKAPKMTESQRKLHRDAASAASRESLASAQEDDDTPSAAGRQRAGERASLRQRPSRNRSRDYDDEDDQSKKRAKSRGRDANQKKSKVPSEVEPEEDVDYSAKKRLSAVEAQKTRRRDTDDILYVDVEPSNNSKKLAKAAQQQQRGSFDEDHVAKPKKKPLGRLASTLLGRKGSKQPSGEQGPSADSSSPISEAEGTKSATQPHADKKAKKEKKRTGSKNDQKTQASLVSITPSTNNDDIDYTPIDATDDHFMISEEQPYYDARGTSVEVRPPPPPPPHEKHKVLSRILHPKSHHKPASTTPSAATSPSKHVDRVAAQQRQQKPPKIILRGQDGEMAGPPAYHTIGGDTFTTEEDEDGQQRRSSRFSIRGRFSSKDNKSKQKLPRDKKSSKKRVPPMQTSTDETSESPLATMTSGVDTETADGRLTADDTDGQARRSSRFSIRGKKDQRSRSKQRKQDKQKPQATEKQQKKAGEPKSTESRKGPLSIEESENALARMAAGGDRDSTALDKHGNRLTTTTDDDSPRPSSRFSIRERISARRADKRSKSKQAKKSKQQLAEEDQEEQRPTTKGKSESKRRKEKGKSPAKKQEDLIELTGTEIDESTADGGERLAATKDDDGKRRSSTLSIRGKKENRSQSKQRKQQKKLTAKSGAPTHLSVEEDGNALLGMTASDAEDTEATTTGGGERLTADMDENGKRRSSRFSIRGMKDQRSRSKQRKQQKKLEKANAKPTSSSKTEMQTDDDGGAFRGMMAHEEDYEQPGDKLTIDDDSESKRRSSRFSIRGRQGKKDGRSRSKQRKDDKKTPVKPTDSKKHEQDTIRPSDETAEEDPYARGSEKRESGRLSIRQRLSRRSSRDDRAPSAEELDADEKPKKHHHVLCHVSGSRKRRHHPDKYGVDGQVYEDDQEPSDFSPQDEEPRESQRTSDEPMERKRKLSKQERKASQERSKSAQRKNKSLAGDSRVSGEMLDDDNLDEAASYTPMKRQAPVKPGGGKTLAARTMTGQPSTVTEETEIVSTKPEDTKSQKSKKSSASKQRKKQHSAPGDEEQTAGEDEPIRRSWSKRRQKPPSLGDGVEEVPPVGKKSRQVSRKDRKNKQKASRDDGYVSTAATGDDYTVDEAGSPNETLDERRARMHKLAEKSKKERVPSRGDEARTKEFDESGLTPKDAKKLRKERSRSKRRGMSRDSSAIDQRLSQVLDDEQQPSQAPSRKSSKVSRKEQKNRRKDERSKNRGSVDRRSTTEAAESRREDRKQKPSRPERSDSQEPSPAATRRNLRVPSITVDTTPEDDTEDPEYNRIQAAQDQARRGSRPATEAGRSRAESLSSKVGLESQQRKRAESSPRPHTREREGSFNYDDEDGRNVTGRQQLSPAKPPSGAKRQQGERASPAKQKENATSKTDQYPALRSSKSDTTERGGRTSRKGSRKDVKQRRSRETSRTSADGSGGPSPSPGRRRSQSIKQLAGQPLYDNFVDNRFPQQEQQQRRKTDNLIDLDEQQRRVSSSVVTQTSNTLLYDRASGGESPPGPAQQLQQTRDRAYSKPATPMATKTSYESVMSGYTTTGTQPPQVFDPNDMITTAEDDDRAYSLVDPVPTPAARKKSSVASAQFFRRQQQQQQQKPTSSRGLTAPGTTTPKSSQVTMHSVRSSLSGQVYAQTAAVAVDDALERASIEAGATDDKSRRQKSPSIPSRPAPGAASRKQSVIQTSQSRRASAPAPPSAPQDNELSHVQQLADGAWRGAAGNRAFAPSTSRPATITQQQPRGGDKQTSSLLQLVASQPHLHPGQHQQQFTVIQISEIIRPRVRQIIARRLALPTVDPSSDSNMAKVVDWIANRAAHRTLLTLAEQQQAAGLSGSSPPFVQDVYRAVEQQIELAVRDMRQLLVQYRQDAAGLLEDGEENAPPTLTPKQLKKQQKEERRSSRQSSRNEKRSRSRANSRQRQSEISRMQQQQQHRHERETSEYHDMDQIRDQSPVADNNSMEPLHKSATQWRRQR